MSEQLPKVLYIGGFPRSGSTLLGRMLGEAPGTVCIGETRYLWTRGVRDNVNCGCGVPFRSCAFWSAVGDDAFGGWSNVTPDVISAIDRSLTWPHTLKFATAMRRSTHRRIGSDGSSHFIALYRAIARVSAATTIVDISKTPGLAILLAQLPEIDLRLVHLVRDSRAVTYSAKRLKPLRGDDPIGVLQFTRPSRAAAVTATQWSGWNLAFHPSLVRHTPHLRLRYEDLIASPQESLAAISRLAGDDLNMPTSQLSDGHIQLGEHHIFSGNPMRADIGWIPFALDDEWRTMMPAIQRTQVTVITSPLLRYYGYRFRL